MARRGLMPGSREEVQVLKRVQAQADSDNRSGSRVPLGYVLLGGAALLGLSSFLIFLSFREWANQDKCQDADLLDTDDCDRLYGETATIFVAVAIAALVIALAGAAIYLVMRRRNGRTEEAALRAPEPPASVEDQDAPVRVCPVCSAQARTNSDTCPHCGSSYIRRRGTRARRRMASMSTAAKLGVAAAIAVLPICAASAAGAMLLRDDRHDEAAQLAEDEKEEEAQEVAAEEAQEALEQEQQERAARQVLVKDLERTITRDAQRESEKPFSIINGPILATQCDPDGGEIDVDSVTQQFSCLAITNYTGGGARGYRYTAVINYDRFSYRWRLGGGGF
jgi:predicted nucleic acid-binding Zn ribbon protein